MKIKTQLLLLVASWLMAGKEAASQPFSLDPHIRPVELNFEEYKKEGEDKAKGRISMNNLTQEKDTMYYFIKGLSMYSPTYFSLNSADPAADIKINLCKENWHTIHHTGNVTGKSIYKNNFKTEGDFGIMVVANKKPAQYVLLVWTGEEMKFEMPSVFKGGDSATGNSGGGWFKKNMLVVIVGIVALLVIAFLLFKLKNKRA